MPDTTKAPEIYARGRNLYEGDILVAGFASAALAEQTVTALRRVPLLQNRIIELEGFKNYVHERLDAMGVPTHPEGPHSLEGCRVGDRLDLVETAIEQAMTLTVEGVQKILEGTQKQIEETGVSPFLIAMGVGRVGLLKLRALFPGVPAVRGVVDSTIAEMEMHAGIVAS